MAGDMSVPEPEVGSSRCALPMPTCCLRTRTNRRFSYLLSFRTCHRLVPRHRGFDGWVAEDCFGGEEYLDASSHPRLAADQAEALQREHQASGMPLSV